MIDTTHINQFEHTVDRAFHIRLARLCLAAVPDSYTEDQLADIGARARHWVLQELRKDLSNLGSSRQPSV
jgi:hypothetical protein